MSREAEPRNGSDTERASRQPAPIAGARGGASLLSSPLGAASLHLLNNALRRMTPPPPFFRPSAYLVVDSEDEWYAEEVAAVEAGVKEHGLTLMVFAEWWVVRGVGEGLSCAGREVGSVGVKELSLHCKQRSVCRAVGSAGQCSEQG